MDGLEITELEQVYDKLYRPDLIAAKARGEDISEYAKEINFASLVRTGKAPTVRIRNVAEKNESRKIQPELVIQDEGGGIGAVKVKLNGLTVQIASEVSKSHMKSIILKLPYAISLQNGENILEAFAYNEAGTVESLHAVQKITWQGSTKKPDLYVFSVGIDEYRLEKLRLKCAVNDAEGIKNVFTRKKSSVYQTTFAELISDSAVTKKGFSEKISELSQKVTEDDIFVLYLSGHGTTCSDGDYYYIPSDIDSIDEKCVMLQAFSKKFIDSSLAKIASAQKVILIDTCKSGAYISAESEKTAVDRLAHDTGFSVLMASAMNKPALEDFEKHGVFTYTLIEGLSGKADLNTDGNVTILELINYAMDILPARSKKKYLYEQIPYASYQGNINTVLTGKK